MDIRPLFSIHHPFLVAALLSTVVSFAETPPPAPAAGTLRVATWNVENLFDADDDPANPGDDEFTPGSWRRWTEERYQAKTRNLAEVIAALRPDVLFLAEVENRAVLTNLVRVLAELPEPYEMPYIAHQDSESVRGIDVAILSRYPLHDVVLHTAVPHMRGTLEATATIDGADATFYACHWKSWIGKAEENIATRQKEAESVRELALQRLAANPDAVFFIAGDFNDNCDGDSLRISLHATIHRDELNAGDGEQMLYHLVGEIPENERGSYYYARRKVWNTFDGIVVPPTMLLRPDLPGSAWRLAAETPHVGVYKSDSGTDNDGRPKPFRRVRKTDGTDEFMDGCSDHFPLWADFQRVERQGDHGD